MTFLTDSPFTGPVPPTVPLQQSPLTGVLVQVQFPEILSIAKTEFVADFQEQIRADYPVHQLEQSPVFEFRSDGVKQSLMPNWRFLDKTMEWRLSLTTNFVSLETRAYQNRTDLIQRTDAVIRALSATIKPGVMTRIGVRYVDRLHGRRQERLSRFVRPEMLGPYTEEHRRNLDRTLSEIVGQTDVGPMTVRWGFMPANQAHEPSLMPPIATPSWFLDIDVYNEFTQPEILDADEIGTRLTRLAARAYGFFRWVVNEEFLRDCGGDI